MRNLKKILALVLALVMSFSLMATANAFTDSEKVTDTYETAVTVLDGLKVFQGYDDGSFQPQGSITRAEVAAIIYRIVTGDVTDTQVGIYADYNKFDDVKSTSWYAGYVNFCANAEYIKGYDAKTFGPNDPVTGYQALAMILRALGYDKNGEFTGTSWQVQTAAVGENRGITKNISAGTLGTAASREVVAEILFRAILVDTVEYTPAFGYQIGDTSLGWETFELEEITGVVIANEYADLYDTKPLKAGKTELDVDGESYTLAYTTTFDDIGEARDAYVTGETVLYIADAGNTVFETGAEADIATASKFEKVTGLERTTTTEQFVNFDGGNTYEASDYRIGYVIAAANIDVDTAAEETAFEAANDGEFSFAANGTRVYEKDIRRGAALTSTDMDIIEMIFDDADFENNTIVIGEVYVGTQSTEDISDEISYKKFLDEYVETNENAVTIEENENGNWLKAIDNDGDGEADVVLQVIYTVAGVQKIAKDGTITLSCEDDKFNDGDALNEITDDNDVITEDELAEDDIVYYALIDGNAYTYKADVVTAEIDKVNRNTYTATTTDGDEYVESGVHEHTGWQEIVSGVRNLEGDVNYDLYLDRFGYLAAFTESDNNAGFVLLTDGWYNEARTNDEYAAMVWDREAQELVDTDITDGGELFIYNEDWYTQNNGWGNLRRFVPLNCNGVNDDIHTIVAALGEDGSLTPVDEIYRYRVNVAMIDMGTTIPVRAHTEDGTIYASTSRAAYDVEKEDVDVRALASTVYYYVYNTPNGNTVVREYVGYDNIPDLGKDKDQVEDVYVVGTRAEDARDDEYYTAEIVVVELKEGYTEIDSEEVFIYDLPVASSGVKYEDVSVIRADGTAETVTIDLSKSDLSAYREYDPAWGKYIMPGLYYMWESDVKDVYVVSKMSWNDIAGSRYVVGTVLKDTATGADDWTSFTPFYNNTNSFNWAIVDSVADFWAQFVIIDSMGETEKKNTADSKYYELDYSENKYGDYVGDLTEGDREDVLPQRKDGGDNEVLVKYNSDNEIVYAISFAQWENESKNIVDFAQDVYAFNTPAAYVAPAPGETTVTFYGKPVEIDNAEGAIDFELEINYADADAAMDPNGISVNNGAIVVGDKITTVTPAGDVYEGTILGNDGAYYTFKLTQKAAAADTTLTSNKPAVATVDPATGVITVLDRQISIKEFVANFSVPAGANVKWTFYNAQGVVAEENYSQSMLDVKDFTAVVTAEDGKTTQTYNDKIDATQVANRLNAIAAAIDSAEDVTAAKAAVDVAKDLLANTSYTDAEKADIQTAIAAVNAAIEEYKAQVAADEEAAQKYANAVKAAEDAIAKKDDYAALVDAEEDLKALKDLDEAQKAKVDALLKEIEDAKAAIVEQKAYEEFLDIVAHAENILDAAANAGDILALQDQLANLDALTPEKYTKVSAEEWLDVVALKDAIKTRIADLTPPTDYEAAVTVAETALEAEPKVEADLKAAQTLLGKLDLDTLTDEQKAYVKELKTDIELALKPFEEARELEQTRAEKQAKYDKIIDETDGGKWPEGAAAAAKRAVAEELAKMNQAALDALNPAKNDSIWSGVIVPVVEEMQEAAAAAEAAEKATTAFENAFNVAQSGEMMGSDLKSYNFEGTFTVEENNVTITFETLENLLSVKYPDDPSNKTMKVTADLARFLGLLYDEEEGVTEIGFGEDTYKWDSSSELVGSKWEKNGSGDTLVEAIITAAAQAIVDYKPGAPLTWSFELTLNGNPYTITLAAEGLGDVDLSTLIPRP